MNDSVVIDLHMHTTVSDGTDTPELILERASEAGLSHFAVTDHDAVRGCTVIRKLLTREHPRFICGAEFSCKDAQGKYHILGYGFDPESEPMRRLVETGHRYRMDKLQRRLDFLKREFGFDFPEEELAHLYALDNPGKPHIGNLMARMGYAANKDEAIRNYVNKIRFKAEYVRPGEAVRAILDGGGIPVLAHPSYGSGDQIIIGEEMEERLEHLIPMGLQGLEAYYSGFTAKLRTEILGFADRYHLYVTAGSDYHGSNKMIEIGDTGLDEADSFHSGLERFLSDVRVEEGS